MLTQPFYNDSGKVVKDAMNQLHNDIQKRYDLLTKLIKQVEKKLKSFPNGRINVKHHKYGDYYYLVDSVSGERYLRKEDSRLAYELIQKNYLDRVLNACKKEASALKRYLDNEPSVIAEDVYETLTEGRKKVVKPIVTTDEQFVREWLAIPFVPKEIEEGSSVFLTSRGERVRSKTEVIIAERLLVRGVPYKYECPIVVNGRVIHPDFTILRIRDRKIIYFEHCGKADDPEYADKRIVQRINDYSHAGIVLGDNLFLTFESSKTPFDVSVLDNLIDRCFT